MSAKAGQRGGVIHTYQRYDPRRFPSPTQPPPDLASHAMEHLLAFGSLRRLTDEELARAVELDPSQIQGLGPSLDALVQLLLERKRKILETYETETVQNTAARQVRGLAAQTHAPDSLNKAYQRAIREQQLHDLERLWYRAERQHPDFARQLLPLIEVLGDQYEVDILAANYDFIGRTAMTIPQALEIKEELEAIDELLKQLEEAKQNAQIGVIDMDKLAEFAEPGDLQQLRHLQQQVENYMRELAEQQGIEQGEQGYRLSPKAYRLFQSKLLQRIFSDLQASRSGRHQGQIVGDGAVEMQKTRPYEFGDSVANLDMTATFTNAMIRSGAKLPVQLKQEDLVVHQTRNTPKCATVVILDMSGSMRYGGMYINAKRMGLALDGLIRSEFPGDRLHFIEMATFARPRPTGEVAQLMPKMPTLHDPIVRLRVDMSDPNVSEIMIPPHFTNIQHALQQARRLLANQDTPNQQIMLITDGLPTAHFEDNMLYLLYPPDERTEQMTLREGHLCRQQGITINMFLIPSWSQSEEDVRFAHRLTESTQGRVFFSAGDDLDRFVVWDYLHRRRQILA